MTSVNILILGSMSEQFLKKIGGSSTVNTRVGIIQFNYHSVYNHDVRLAILILDDDSEEELHTELSKIPPHLDVLVFYHTTSAYMSRLSGKINRMEEYCSIYHIQYGTNINIYDRDCVKIMVMTIVNIYDIF